MTKDPAIRRARMIRASAYPANFSGIFMIDRVHFSRPVSSADRIHFVNADDVRVLLARLPAELWQRLRVVHFNDRSFGGRRFGYVTGRGRREITLCAMPPRMALTRALRMGQTPEEFGAKPNQKWPTLAIRRFMLYDVFLHELGHLQFGERPTRSKRLRFAGEKQAQEFAMEWCGQLWSQPFDHPDPVHNPPSADELRG